MDQIPFEFEIFEVKIQWPKIMLLTKTTVCKTKTISYKYHQKQNGNPSEILSSPFYVLFAF
jgi:hypothetical protein